MINTPRSVVRNGLQVAMAQNTLPHSTRLQVEEHDQAGQVIARYVASGSNGRVDVIVRFVQSLMKIE